MAVINEENFRKILKSELPCNVFFIFGNDDYLKEYYCDRLISAVVDDSLRLFNFHSYDESEKELDEIFADAENLPVMAEKSCLLIKNYPLSELGAKELNGFSQRLTEIPQSTVMIFYFSAAAADISSKKSAKWSAVAAVGEKCGITAVIDKRTPAGIAKLLQKKAQEHGCEIDDDTALYFVDCVGEDMRTVHNEFEKLCGFADKAKITKEMIDAVTVKSVEASVFDISTAIFNSDADRAFAAANELLRQKVPLQSIIGALAGSYVNIYRSKTALNSGHGVADFAEEFGYQKKSSYVFNKLSAFTRKSSIASIRLAIDALAQADRRSKSSRTDDSILLTELIAKLVSAAKSSAAN